MNAWNKFTTRVRRYGLSYVCGVILRNKIYYPLDQKTMAIGKKLFGNRRLTDTILLESHNDFDSNGGAFYQYLIRNGYNEKYRIVWLLRNKKPKNLPKNVTGINMFRPSLRKAYYHCTSKYLCSDHVISTKVQEGQIAVYQTHGPVGLKGFKGKIILPADGLTAVLAPSPFLAPILANEYGIPYPNDLQQILGYPCHDVLYDDTPGDLSKITRQTYRKVILWMPTFRKPLDFTRNDSTRELPLGIPIFNSMEEVEAFNHRLAQENTLMIVKIHPMQDMTTVKIHSLSNITVLDGVAVKRLGVDNFRLMKDTDAIISDYSSVAYDFLHLDRPIGYTLDDAEDYTAGFIVDDPRSLMAGHLIYDQKQFTAFVEDVLVGNDPYRDARHQLFDKVFACHDGNSSQRLAAFMGLEK